ncbi:hypothetical protein ACA910_006608 [Epithemia clementina (nom. ined.)]
MAPIFLPIPGDTRQAACLIKAILEAIDYAYARNVMVVFAAGNDGSNAQHYPAYYSKAIAVAATDNDGVAASFTNFGRDWIDIAAPGVKIVSTGFSRYHSNADSNQYKYKSGTSLACAHVSGVLALGKCLYPSASAPELKTCLFDTAKNISNPDLGSGLVNPPGFLNCVLDLMGDGPTPAPTPVSSQAPDFDSNPGSHTTSFTGSFSGSPGSPNS